MSKSQKKNLARIAIAAILFLIAVLITHPMLKAAIFFAAYLIVGYDVLKDAAIHLFHGQMLDENFLMSVATIGAFAIGEYPEGVFVMLFAQIGTFFEHFAVNRSRDSIQKMMELQPETARVYRDDALIEVSPEELSVGDVIAVFPGDKIAADGIIIEGSSSLDTAALTGESLPRSVTENDEVLSGCINQEGLLKVRVTKEYYDSTFAKVLELVETAASQKARSEQFITRFAHYYTPFVVIAALLIVIFPPLFFGFDTFRQWLHTALIFLVISCPCALVISVPLGFFSGIGAAAKEGILIKGSNYLEMLAQAQTIAFDKTGTLTEGAFSVTQILPWANSAISLTETELLEYAAYAESTSNHPIAQSLLRAYGQPIDRSRFGQATEFAGKGLQVEIDQKIISLGNAGLMADLGIETPSVEKIGTIVYLAIDHTYAGCILLNDTIKPTTLRAIDALRHIGITQTAMLSGDKSSVADHIAAKLSIDKTYSELLPADKVRVFQEIKDQMPPKKRLLYVGDGINDAPVLALADCGISMGAMGSDAAIEAADVVIMDDDMRKIPLAIALSRKTMRIVKENIVFALGVKFLVMLMGVFGMANLWEAVFADVGVSVIAISNAMRLLQIHTLKKRFLSET